MGGKSARGPRSLVAFVDAKRGVGCAVCALPTAVLEEITSNRDRHRFPLDVILEWLKVEHRIKITRQQYTLHTRGGHVWRKARVRT